jgi:hypothetical protein
MTASTTEPSIMHEIATEILYSTGALGGISSRAVPQLTKPLIGQDFLGSLQLILQIALSSALPAHWIVVERFVATFGKPSLFLYVKEWSY